MRIPARRKVAMGTTTWNWRTKIVRKNTLQVLLLSMFVLFLTAWAGAQSAQEAATPSTATTGSSSTQQSDQQELRDELKALRAEVERLRAEVEQQKAPAV